MPSESEILQSFNVDAPEEDQLTDIASDLQERSAGKVPDDADTQELDDGSAVIKLHDDDEVEKAKEFYDNLADDIEDADLRDMAVHLLDLFDLDVEARADRDKQYEEGLQRTGFGGDSPGGASFDGASKVTDPLIAEVAIDYSARQIKELWPVGGPAKDKIIGEVTDKKVEKAKRKVSWLNYQLTEVMPSTRYEIEQILTQVPMGGVQYSKLWWDVKRKKPCHEPVWVDKIVIPYSATSFYDCPRKAHIMDLDKFTFDDKVRNGVFRDVDYLDSVQEPDQTKAQAANAKIEGKSPSSQNEDKVRTVIEFSVQYLVADPKRGITDPEDTEEGPAPYLITIDKETRNVLSIYRNWDEDDDNMDALVHIIEWPFLPWRGAMPIGIPQILGGLAAASTGALRSLLDSALINNFPGGVRLKSGPMGGQSVPVAQNQTTEIDGGIMQDDIRKTFMPTPVNPTSQTLMNLLEFLIERGKDIVKTTLDEANDNANVPVGTIMARIEQQMVVFSAIHARMHNAMGKFLKVLNRLNATYLEDEDVLKMTGEQMVFKADFDTPDDVVPVSDPEIFSELQRAAQMQTLAQRAMVHPELYDARKIEEGICKLMKIPNPEQYLLPKPEPKPLNAVNENIAASFGQPITAFPDQDHLAHIQVHLDFIQDPLFGANPLMAAQSINGLLENIKQHMLFWYGTEIHRIASEAAGADITQFMTVKDSEVQTRLDALLAAASQNLHPQTQQVFGKLPPIIQKAQQILQSHMPPQPQDPTAVAAQVAQNDKADNDAKNQIATQKLQQEAQNDAQQNALDQAEQSLQDSMQTKQITADATTADGNNQAKQQIADGNNQTKVQVVQSQDATKLTTVAEDNRVAEEIAGAEIAAGHSTQIKDGAAVGKKPSEV
jgi:hypothetical protein